MNMTPLTHLSVLEFHGTDAKSFLHNQLSANIADLAAGDSTFACYCHPNGRVIALMLVCCLQESYQVILASDLADSVTARLRMFVLRDDVQISDSDAFTVFGLTDTSAPDGAYNPCESFYYRVQGDTSEAVTPSPVFRAAELQAGICWLSAETTQQFLPQMLGYQSIGALDFHKGCYPGQEIVARTQYLGKLKRRPCITHSESGPGVSRASKVKLANAEAEITAELIQSIDEVNNETISLLVARTMEPFEADQLIAADKTIPVRLTWFE